MMRKLAPYWKKCIRCPRGQRFNEFWISNIKYRQGAWSNNQLGLAKQPFKPNPKWLRRAYINFSSVASVEDSCYSWQKLSVIAPDGAAYGHVLTSLHSTHRLRRPAPGRLFLLGQPFSGFPPRATNEDSSGANHRHFVRVPLCRLERLPNKIRLILFAECLLHGCR